MWKCTLCLAFFLTLRLLVRHLYLEHSNNPGFMVQCSVEGCPSTYTKWNSLYRHVNRDHSHVLDVCRDAEDNRADNAPANEEPTPDEVETNDIANPDQINAVHQDEENIGQIELEAGVHVLNRNDSDNDEHDNSDNDIPANENDLYLESDYREAIQRQVAIYTMTLKEMYKTREATTEFIAEQTNLIVMQHLDHIKEKVNEIMERGRINEVEKNLINEVFETTDLPFTGLLTSYERNKYIRNTFSIVEPEVICVGQEAKLKRKRGQQSLEVMDVSYTYIPLLESIEQFLQNHKIADLVFSNPNYAPRGYLSDFVDGSIFQQHQLFMESSDALRLVIYYDDLEICNPLGKRAGIHKIGVFYYSISNLPMIYRSRLPAIRVLAIIKRKTMNDYGINIMLQRINQDLEKLSEGVRMKIKGEDKTVKGAAIAFVGDTLACHEFSGFKIGVGFAFQKCRECECTNVDMQNKFHERFFQQRTLQRYDNQCREIERARTKGMKRRLSMAYGINVRSCARDWPFFNLLKMTPEDIMHVVYEGVALYEVKIGLKALVDQEFFTLNNLNNLISSFPYGYKDRECQPSCIPDSVFNNDDTSLRQSASSMVVFLKFLPFMLIEKLNCDPENKYVELLTELCEIIKLLMASVVSIESIEMIRMMIESHLNKFKCIFPDKNIIPKQHYLAHLLNAILKYGPLNLVSSMRYEGKHQFIKQRMTGNPNFKNILKSISERVVMYEASLNIGENHPLFSNDLIIGKVKSVDNIYDTKNKISAFFGTDVNIIQSVHSVSWIILNGQRFVKNQCQVAFGENNSLPEFGTLKDIIVTQENNTSIFISH